MPQGTRQINDTIEGLLWNKLQTDFIQVHERSECAGGVMVKGSEKEINEPSSNASQDCSIHLYLQKYPWEG